MAHIMGLGNQSESLKIIILSKKFTHYYYSQFLLCWFLGALVDGLAEGNVPPQVLLACPSASDAAAIPLQYRGLFVPTLGALVLKSPERDIQGFNHKQSPQERQTDVHAKLMMIINSRNPEANLSFPLPHKLCMSLIQRVDGVGCISRRVD